MKLINIVIGFMLILSATLVYAGREKGGTADINIGVGELQETTGGTEDINIGVGELQETTEESRPGGSRITTDDGNGTKTMMLVPAVQKPKRYGGYGKSKKGGNVEMEWKVEEGEK
jgi:hypothetical protein